MRQFVVALPLALAALAAGTDALRAQGFGLYEQGACTMGRAGAGVAAPCADGSAVFYNPAGVALAGKKLMIGGAGIVPASTFVNDNTGLAGELNSGVVSLPNAYITGPVSDNVAIGLGLFTPYGLSTEWDASSFEGRFLGYRTRLRGVYVQPTIAAKLGRLAIGGGVDFTNLSVKLQQRLDLAALPVPSASLPPGTTFGTLGVPYGTDFADAILDGNNWGVGYHLGILWQAHDKLSIGLRYMSRQEITIDDGEARFRQVPTGLILPAGNPFGAPQGTPVDAILAPNFGSGALLGTQGATTTISLPDQAVVGIAVKPMPRLALMVDAQYTWWNAFEEVPIDLERAPDNTLVENYRPVWTIRSGLEYVVSPARQTVVRGGFYTHRAASPTAAVTPNIPEGPRTGISAGVGTRIGGLATLDLAYTYLDQGDRRGRTTPSLVPTGVYQDAHAHLFAAAVTFDF